MTLLPVLLGSGGVLLPGLHGWVYPLVELHVQAGLHAEHFGWEGMLAVFQDQLGPLASLCNHI